MKVIFLICITVAVASYNSPQYPPQKYPAPYGASYGKYEPYARSYSYPKWYKHKYSSSSSEGYYDCWWKYDSDESHARKSKRCSYCRPIKVLKDGSKWSASIRHNTLSSGCAQAIISCPKSALFGIISTSRNGHQIKTTTLAIGKGNDVVALCGHDRKWHTSSLTMKDVTVHTVDCIQLLLKDEREQMTVNAITNPDDERGDGSGDADDDSLNQIQTTLDNI